jgi:truncated hemoglobin YjbI
MAFDNEKFTAWLQEFERALIDCGMPEPQAKKFRGEFYGDAVGHFVAGRTADESAVYEVMNIG